MATWPIRRMVLGCSLLCGCLGGTPTVMNGGMPDLGTVAPNPNPNPNPGPNPPPNRDAGVLPPSPDLSPPPSMDGGAPGATYMIVPVAGGPLKAVVGDALPLKVVQTLSGGAQMALPPGATVTWSGPPAVTALPAGSVAASPLPVPGNNATAFFLTVTDRPDHIVDLAGVLFVLDAGKTANGKVTVNATVAGLGAAVHVSADIPVAPTPPGNPILGATTYAMRCASCHGPTGNGSPVYGTGADGNPIYQMAGQIVAFPAVGLNAGPCNDAAAGMPWNGSLYALASRGNIDFLGVTLRSPMPNYLNVTLTTQDYADIFAYLVTQLQ